MGGEFLLGNISMRRLPALLILVLLYGCGALLIREVTLRTGRGWPTILLLGAAYGVIEAGIVDQAMFNPSFEGWEFQAITPVPPLGISAWYAWTFVVGHSVWSIAVPIALVELLFPARARTLWLGRVGLVLTAAGYVAGCVVIGRFVNGSERFLASPSQLAGAAAVVLGLVALAFACRPVTPPVGNGWVPRRLHLGLGLFLAPGVYQVRPESWAGLVFNPAWSPDGSQIATVGYEGNPQAELPKRSVLAIVTVASDEIKVLGELESSAGLLHSFPRWSSAGDAFVISLDHFKGDEFVGGRIAVIRRTAAGWSKPKSITKLVGGPRADWHPTEDLIVFCTNDVGSLEVTDEPSNLFTVRPDGSKLSQITDYGLGKERASQPTWTADGRIIFDHITGAND